MAHPEESSSTRSDLAPAMRVTLWAAAALVLLAGTPLMVFPRRTDELFVFPISPALTAGFIGANYWAAVVIETMSAMRRRWVDVRASLPGVFAFTSLTGVVSILNRGQFDLSAAASWIWIGVYVLFPVVILLAWWRQRRSGTASPARISTLPAGLRALLGLLGVVLLGVGAGLIVYPIEASAAWAWALTTPDAAYRTESGTSVEPYVGCWLVGIGLVLVGATAENDAVRVRPIFAGLVALTILQFASLARLGGPVAWDRVIAWAFVGVLVAIGAAGAWGLGAGRRAASV